VLVEPNPALARRIRASRPKALLFECAVGAREDCEVILQIPEGAETLASISNGSTQMQRMLRSAPRIKTVAVKETTLDRVLSDAGVTHLDFVTIDVEGHELEVLRGFSLERWKPRIVIVEDNSSGTSDEVLNYMRLRGYVRIRNTGCNDWYCGADDAALVHPLRMFSTECKKALKGIKKVVLRHVRRVGEIRGTRKRPQLIV
jgi:FkbM family methyltransferase